MSSITANIILGIFLLGYAGPVSCFDDALIENDLCSDSCSVENLQCPSNRFRCNNSACIKKTHLCNGINNCGDNSDELSGCTEYVKEHVCQREHFRCNNFICIPQNWRCDGIDDCGDSSDEKTDCDLQSCPSNSFRCKNHVCLLMYLVCNGENNCGDMSDEIGCNWSMCHPGFFQCNQSAYKECIYPQFVCDGDWDCSDESDEWNCPCTSKYFQCHDSENSCVQKSDVCDGFDDCGNNMDETFCSDDTNVLSRWCCLIEHFRCKNRKCVNSSLICDKHDDCGDNSDETGCATCDVDEFLCYNNSFCIPQTWVCDGFNDCSDNSEEIEPVCINGIRVCYQDELLCDGSFCVRPTHVCNNVTDCMDGTDEGADCTESSAAVSWIVPPSARIYVYVGIAATSSLLVALTVSKSQLFRNGERMFAQTFD